MEIKIAISDKERQGVLKALEYLNSIAHIKSMPQTLIAREAAIKPTKVRVVLIDLIEQKFIEQYSVNNANKRYYYILTEAGKDFLNIQDNLEKNKEN